jgi:hypothetical protein
MYRVDSVNKIATEIETPVKQTSVFRKPQSNPLFFQPKLTIAPINDPYEREADAVADSVMRSSGNESIQTKISPVDIQRKCASNNTEEQVQRKEGLDTGPQTDVSLLVSDAVNAGGRPLDDHTRSYMENRIGHDFSDVKIHTDSIAAKSAQSINALAYTHGNDIVFNEGRYNPESSEGKHLLAHELTHTVQQKNNGQGSVQRMVEVNEGVDLDTMGYSVKRTGNYYTNSAVSKSSVWNEIVTGLFFSDRIFKVKGATSSEANKNFMAHIKSRYGIIEFASKKKYTFAAGAGFKMNPEYWTVDPGISWSLKSGADKQKAMDDVNVHPEEYAIACLAATKITMEGGGKSPIRVEGNNEANDWIPGDWGYIENTKFPAGGTPGLEGENIIYVGLDKFWGHFGPGIEYKTLKQWFDQVYSWNKGAEIEDTRKYPTKGLE